MSEYPQKQKRMMKLDPMNQLFMTLMKLRINLKTLDLSYRFGISVSAVSRSWASPGGGGGGLRD